MLSPSPRSDPSRRPPRPSDRGDPGDLAQRLSSLEEVERIADIDHETAMQVAAPVLRMWHEGTVERRKEWDANWPGVVFNFFPQSTAIPPNARRKRPGVPGEGIAYEAGLMMVGENQPQHSFTWVMAIALQIMPNGAGRLHACITTEEWRKAEATTNRSYSGPARSGPRRTPEASRQVLTSIIEALPDARSKFDELRGGRTGS